MLVGIAGHKRHGKDSLYKMCLAPRMFERLAFADPMKVYLLAERVVHARNDARRDGRETMPAGLRALWESYYAFTGPWKTPEMRRALQRFGTDVVRTQLDSGYWMAFTLRHVRDLVEEGMPVAYTDVRIPAEGHAIRGDVAWLEEWYEKARMSGERIDEEVAWLLTHTWDEERPNDGLRGLIPSTPGVVLRVQRPGVDGARDQHATEREVDAIPLDAEPIINDGLEILRARGDSALDALGVPRMALRGEAREGFVPNETGVGVPGVGGF